MSFKLKFEQKHRLTYYDMYMIKILKYSLLDIFFMSSSN